MQFIYRPVSSVSLSFWAPGPHLLCSLVLYCWNHAVYGTIIEPWSGVVLVPWAFDLEYWGPIALHLVIHTCHEVLTFESVEEFR